MRTALVNVLFGAALVLLLLSACSRSDRMLGANLLQN